MELIISEKGKVTALDSVRKATSKLTTRRVTHYPG